MGEEGNKIQTGGKEIRNPQGMCSPLPGRLHGSAKRAPDTQNKKHPSLAGSLGRSSIVGTLNPKR